MNNQTHLTKRKLREEETLFHKTQKLGRKCRPHNTSLQDSTSTLAEDRLSELPNVVMQHILSFCPVRKAVEVCTLSRQWKSLWASMPKLSFEDCGWYDVNQFASFVDKALMLYSAPKVKEFSLEFIYKDRFKDRVDSWLRFTVTHEVEKLYLDLRGCRYLLSDDVFGGCCWKSLNVLSLRSVSLGTEMITSIFHGSPFMKCLALSFCTLIGSSFVIDAANTRLEKLFLSDCKIECDSNAIHAAERRGYVEIKAPDLLSLTVEGYMDSTSLILVDVSSLIEANIGLEMTSPPALLKEMINNSLEKLFHVTRLTVGGLVLQVLSIMRLAGEIIPTSRCKTLKLQMKLYKRYLPGIEALLDSSPYLEQLIMNVSSGACDEPTICRIKQSVEESYWGSETRNYSCLNKNLRRVEVIGFVPESSKI